MSARESVTPDPVSSADASLGLSDSPVSPLVTFPNTFPLVGLRENPTPELPKGDGIFPNKPPEVALDDVLVVASLPEPPKTLCSALNTDRAGLSAVFDELELLPNNDALGVGSAAPKVTLEPGTVSPVFLSDPPKTKALLEELDVESDPPKVNGLGVEVEAIDGPDEKGFEGTLLDNVEFPKMGAPVVPKLGLKPPVVVGAVDELTGGKAEPPKPENDAGGTGSLGALAAGAALDELATPLTDGALEFFCLASYSF